MAAVSKLSPHGGGVNSGKHNTELLYLLCIPVLTHSIWAMTNSTYPEGLLPTTHFWNQFLYQLRFCCNNRNHFRLTLSRERNTKSPRRGSLYVINQRLGSWGSSQDWGLRGLPWNSWGQGCCIHVSCVTFSEDTYQLFLSLSSQFYNYQASICDRSRVSHMSTSEKSLDLSPGPAAEETGVSIENSPLLYSISLCPGTSFH